MSDEKERDPLDPQHFEKVEAEILQGEVMDEPAPESIDDLEDMEGMDDMPSQEEMNEVLTILVSTGLVSFGGLLAMKFGENMKLSDDETEKLTKVWTVTVSNSPNWIMRKLSNSPLGLATVMTLGVFGSKFAKATKAENDIQKET